MINWKMGIFFSDLVFLALYLKTGSGNGHFFYFIRKVMSYDMYKNQVYILTVFLYMIV